MNLYFQLARQALNVGVKVLGGVEGSVIAVPRFICADVPETLRRLGYEVAYYDTTPDLQPDFHTSAPRCDYLVAVNYFGFPVDIEKLTSQWNIPYSRIIEDNAHGQYSRDSQGRLLGFRTRVGFTSFRKTLRTIDGGILHVNDRDLESLLGTEALVPQARSSSPGLLFRKLANQIQRTTHLPVMNLARSIKRTASRGEVASFDPLSASPTAVSQASLDRLQSTDAESEVLRRRGKYASIAPTIDSCGGRLMFPNLPLGVSPYGIPFIATQDTANRIQRALWWNGLEVFSWPDLPRDCGQISGWQRQVRIVSFLE